MADLMQPVSRVIGEHRDRILKAIDGSPGAARAGQWTTAALQNDQAMETIIRCCYELLPGLVRLAVKEPAFRTFMLNNRERILAQLVPPGPRAA
ncbi:hypothetical protein IP91_03022 [Pseudoduganella lurida]|uniref:Uncharacterized protein n=1 Tax=Pseudoduganella lurida TaxID=1036180 RepID=A0A562R799_9BURK|nr:hypothetical protein [Pseudoduganella lurida]TWI64256.1 hypothetical protein IP91_03022 [Pseudoduganella lurida]